MDSVDTEMQMMALHMQKISKVCLGHCCFFFFPKGSHDLLVTQEMNSLSHNWHLKIRPRLNFFKKRTLCIVQILFWKFLFHYK